MKPLFDREKCYRCKWSGRMAGMAGSKYSKIKNTICSYGTLSPGMRTCLRKTEDGIIDIRGDDPENCKLYVRK